MGMTRTTRKLSILAAALFTISVPLQAQDNAMPSPESQLLLFFKVLTYDRNILETARGDLMNIGVLLPPEGDDSDWAKASTKLDSIAVNHTFRGKHVRLNFHRYDGPGAVQSWLSSHSFSAIVYAIPVDRIDGKILSRIESMKIRSCASQHEKLAKGALITLYFETTKPEIVINLGISKKMQCDFSSNLLKIARLIE